MQHFTTQEYFRRVSWVCATLWLWIACWLCGRPRRTWQMSISLSWGKISHPYTCSVVLSIWPCNSHCPISGTPQRTYSHDIWFTRSRARENKAILILKLQHFVNKIKAKVLETGMQLRSSEESHMQLTHDLRAAKRSTTTWMVTTATFMLMLLSLLLRMVAWYGGPSLVGVFWGCLCFHSHWQHMWCRDVLFWLHCIFWFMYIGVATCA